MRHLRSLLAGLGLMAVSLPAHALEQAYTYSVVHPRYGVIGTFTETIAAVDGVTRMSSRLRVAVRILGIVVHRETGDYTEMFRGGRLVSLQARTVTNGHGVDVRGEARSDHFDVTTAAGVAKAPSEVGPSDPWTLKTVGVGTVVSLKTGHIIPTRVSGGEPATASIQGVAVPTHHFVARGERQQETWINDHDVPVKFRSVEDGTAIDFILTSSLSDAALADARIVPAANLKRESLK